ncbi:hypothetical protein MD273_16775 [Marinobacter pelagius]|uniref:hypothetical protein n=1 Tax=Marinobacter sp. C7 TaxID=2951363 RepID=UPI001EF0D265|nr:hypothetical protein [Marinobacter sp. C7]MCG7201393.1 hypothetical protein [Marinobacter sp. C7]
MAAVNAVGYVGADNHRRFQCLVAICLLGVAVWVLLFSVERTATRAEQQGMQLMLNQLRSALVVKGAEVMLASGESLEQWSGTNPVSLLRETPRNWGGACSEGGPQPGTWCFSESSGLLLYQPRWLDSVAEGESLQWRVVTEFVESGESGARRAVGLSLNRVKNGQ